jgi:hypothetical protein
LFLWFSRMGRRAVFLSRFCVFGFVTTHPRKYRTIA